MRRSFINEAILSAEKSDLKVANHGAVVIYRGKIVGRGCNKYCSPSVNKVNTWSVHAEVDAINNALRKISYEDLRKSTLIVVRKLKDNGEYSKHPRSDICQEIGNSEPCRHCANYIRRHNIRSCYFS
jgi:deoxycytidylate deaminase